MIYVDARGRIGNQMFQYAIARDFQLRTGQKIVISHYNLNKHHKDWPYSLDQLLLNSEVVHSTDRLPIFADTDRLPLKTARHFFPMTTFRFLSNFGIYELMDTNYIEVPFDYHKNYYFIGIWQSEKYFGKASELLKDELRPKFVNYKKNSRLYNLMESTDSVCVSIRRGDYVDDPSTRKKFYVCDEQYFRTAIEKVKEDIPNATLFLFSNDVDWARDNINFDGDIYAEDGTDTPEEKLNLMASCKHFVISNSTFSWWAQYMSKNKNKKVYAPSRWLPTHKSSAECALYNDSWKLIDV